jgi:hypothetical protein
VDSYPDPAGDLLEEMRTDNPDAWWSVPWEELGGRTPTKALADGDDSAVYALIVEWGKRSMALAVRHREDRAYMDNLQARSVALHGS